MKIIIGADICVTESNKENFVSGNLKDLIGEELLHILDTSDIRIFNLEGPLINGGVPIKKCGPNLKMPEQSIQGIKKLNPSLLTLANNHIMDYGEEGLESTQKILDTVQIPYVGVGKTPEEAAKPYYMKCKDMMVGVYVCCEHEFTVVEENKSGANPFDFLNSFDAIREAKKKCDYLIVLYHGGREEYRYPSPEVQKIFRKMASCGADVVIAQHTHCIGCFEKYSESILVYGQGNFIFDDMDNEFWNSGALISITLNRNEINTEFIPFCKQKNGNIRLAQEQDKEKIMNDFYERSKEVVDPEFVSKNYAKYAQEKLNQALRVLNGNIARMLPFRILNKLTGNQLIRKFYNEKSRLAVLDYIECEAHREMIIDALKKY